jgi:outer membrane protein assembly factor BamA
MCLAQINLAHPLRKHDGDRTQRFQFGLGWQFL